MPARQEGRNGLVEMTKGRWRNGAMNRKEAKLGVDVGNRSTQFRSSVDVRP
jgi:hypothetical protein